MIDHNDLELLNLPLALARAGAELKSRTFVYDRACWQVINHSKSKWLGSLEQNLLKDTFRPSDCIYCDTPKENFTIRPGGWLSPEDHVVYTACVGALFPHIKNRLIQVEPKSDYCNPINDNIEKTEWVGDWFKELKLFRADSLKQIEKGAAFVVFGDIAGFYENIDIGMLISDLKNIVGKSKIIDLLSICLNKWAQFQSRGIPQGFFASDILAKVYLNSLDLSLRNAGYLHFRWNDDFRLFCGNKVQAKEALWELIRLLRSRGLSIQSQKTKILDAQSAGDKVNGLVPILEEVRTNYISEILGALELGDMYVPLAELEILLAESEEHAPLEIIREAFRVYFLEGSAHFDKTLFRFLLGRFGKAKDLFAAEYCQTALIEHPQETTAVLKYFAACEYFPENDLISFLNSNQAIYPYQNFLVFDFLTDEHTQLSRDLLSVARRFSFDSSEPLYLQSIAKHCLGEHGNDGDREKIERDYPSARGLRDKIDIIYSLRSTERSRRNAFLGRVKSDSDFHGLTVEYIRAIF